MKVVNEVIRAEFISSVLLWFKEYGRKNLPWQKDPTAYRVWISEIMLQQTQVKTVIPYYEKFMKCFPNIEDLAKASNDQVMAQWSGLGYYSRARNLHKTAIELCKNRGQSEFPDTIEELQSLAGIGRSTAGAILALAMNKKASILDGNVKRVLARCFAISGWPGKADVAKKLWQVTESLTPENDVKAYTQALMDIGATICTPRNMTCEDCPLSNICIALKQDNQVLYPGKKPKKKIPVRSQYFCLLMSKNGELLMEKRPPSGIWGGLWTPISCDLEFNLGEYLENTYSIEASNQQRLEEFRHTFSHFHLQLVPVKADVTKMLSIAEDNLRWNSLDNWLKEGIPAAVRVMIEDLSANLEKD